MARSAAAALAALILPGSLLAQEPTPPLEVPSGTHTVVEYDTLWDLAQVYFDDPWVWPTIWDANRALVDDPDLIFPGWVLTIPGLEGPEGQEGDPGEVIEIEVEPTQAPAPQREEQRANLRETRTVFYEDPRAFQESVAALGEISYPVISRDGVHSAPWLIPLFTEPEYMGVLEGTATEGRVRTLMIRTYERVNVSLDAGTVGVGDLLQTYRVSRTIPDVGQVVQPTGIVTVSELREDGVIGIVTREFDRVSAGDFVRPAPRYTLEAADRAEPISGGSESVILGFASRAELHGVSAIAFLDIGSDDGVAVGDVFELFDRSAGSAITVGSLRVVGVRPEGSAARILQMDGAVFNTGVVVQLTRKMR